MAMLYGQGHSPKDIFDPTKLVEEKREAGWYVMDLYRRAADPEQLSEVHREYFTLMENFNQRVQMSPLPKVDLGSPSSVMDNYCQLYLLGEVGFNFFQEARNLQLPGEEQRLEKLKDNMYEISYATVGSLRLTKANYTVLTGGAGDGSKAPTTQLMMGDAAQQLVGEYFDGTTRGGTLIEAKKGGFLKSIQESLYADYEQNFKDNPTLTLELLRGGPTCQVTYDPVKKITSVSTALDERLRKIPSYHVYQDGRSGLLPDAAKVAPKKTSFGQLVEQDTKSPKAAQAAKPDAKSVKAIQEAPKQDKETQPKVQAKK